LGLTIPHSSIAFVPRLRRPLRSLDPPGFRIVDPDPRSP
jgi:hypothetical protein